MGNQEDFPTDLTAEEQFAGFQLRWITNDKRGRADQPEWIKAAVYVFRNHYRLVKLYDHNLGRMFYDLQMYSIFAPKKSWYRPQAAETPAWHRIKYPPEYRLSDPIRVTEHVAAWIDKNPDQECQPRDAPELELVECPYSPGGT
jgi:hypothetical protein